MDKVGFAMLSEYNCAYKNICAIKARYKDLITTQNNLLEEVIEKRAKALADGKKQSEVEAEFPRLAIDTEIRRLENERDEALKPFTTTARACVKTIPESLYGGYVYAMEKGLSAQVGANGADIKVGEKTIHIERSFVADIKAIVTEWGMGHADDDKAVNKFADIIKGRISGMSKDAKGGYLKLKTKSQLSELFVLATIQYFIDKGVFATNDDFTLAIVK